MNLAWCEEKSHNNNDNNNNNNNDDGKQSNPRKPNGVSTKSVQQQC